MELAITTERDANARVIVAASGAIDLESRSELLEAGRAALQDASAKALVLDLAGVTFIDSTGIGVLVQLAGATVELGLEFSIARPSNRVVRILEVTGLSQEWTIEQLPES